MRVSAILKGLPDSLGRKTIYIRINEGQKRTFKATQLKILPSEFERGLMKPGPNSVKFNQKIRQLIVVEESKYMGGFSKYPDADFEDYLNDCLRQWAHKAKSTLTQARTEGLKFLKWSGPIKLSKVTLSVLNEYKHFLFTKGNKGKPYDGNTVAKSFKNLKTLISKAKLEKIIEDNPFDLFEMPPYRDPMKEYLTLDQVDEIDKFSKDKYVPEILIHVATWFVIGCYTGLRHSDMIRFNRKKHLVNNRLVMETQKTKGIIGLPVDEFLHELFKRVDYKPLRYGNQNYNKHLKKVGLACEIPIPLTAHLSRHTFAVMSADAGNSPEVTAAMMGTTGRTVYVYYKITNERVDKATENMRRKQVRTPQELRNKPVGLQ